MISHHNDEEAVEQEGRKQLEREASIFLTAGPESAVLRSWILSDDVRRRCDLSIIDLCWSPKAMPELEPTLLISFSGAPTLKMRVLAGQEVAFMSVVGRH
jgi:hypothetical protein